jgi:hypothetical protein
MIANMSQSKIVKTAKNFLKNNSGSLAVNFGIVLVPVFMALGMGVDAVRLTREQASFQASVDAAALALGADERAITDHLAGAALAARKEELGVLAQKVIEANYTKEGGNPQKFTVDIVITAKVVRIHATLEYKPLLTRGFNNGFDAPYVAEVRKPGRPTEIVLVMDTTGSMKRDMVGLQQASRQLLAALYGDEGTTSPRASEFIRVALVPFSGAVRLDPDAHDFNWNWIDRNGSNPLSTMNFTGGALNNYTAWEQLRRNNGASHTWNGCVESRARSGAGGLNLITEDVAPISGETRFPAYFNPDSPTYDTQYQYWVPQNANGTHNAGGYYLNNMYISSWANYASSGDSAPELLGNNSKSTGFDDSGIGNTQASFDLRFKNPAKYLGKNIGDENPTKVVKTEIVDGEAVTFDEWSVNRGPWSNCTGSRVVPMTYHRSRIEDGIDSMIALGGTNITEGLAWGYRAISPTEPFTKVEQSAGLNLTSLDGSHTRIAPFQGSKWRKVMVLMTDGENDPYSRFSPNAQGVRVAVDFLDTGTSYNSYGYSKAPVANSLNRFGSNDFGDADNRMDADTLDICEKIKTSGVELYTVGFRVENALLSTCATDADHYKKANSVSELLKLFADIGADTRNKMLYVSK